VKGKNMTQLTLAEEFVNSGMGWNRQKQTASVNSRKNYRNHLQQFGLFLEKRGKSVEAVNDEDIDEYLADMKRRGYQLNTIAVKMAALSSYFKWLKHTGAITHCPTIKSQPHFPGIHKKVPDAVLSALFMKISGDGFKEVRDTAMIALIAFCGFKTEQVVALNLGDIDAENDRIKGMPMNGISGSITKYTLQRGSGEPKEPLFVNKHAKRITARSLRRHLSKYLEDLNISETYSTRDLQHTFRCKQEEAKTIKSEELC
jgi:site-specific recombinase XerD